MSVKANRTRRRDWTLSAVSQRARQLRASHLEGIDCSSLLAKFRISEVCSIESLHDYLSGAAGGQNVRRKVGAVMSPRVELRHIRLDRTEVAMLTADLDMTVAAALPPHSPYLLQFPLRGEIEAEIDGQPIQVRPGQGLLISPPCKARRRSHPGSVLAFAIDQSLVRDRLLLRLGKRPRSALRFHPLVSSAARDLFEYVQLIVNAVDQSRLSEGRAITATLEAGLVDLLLETQPHSQSGIIANAESTRANQTVQVARDYILRNINGEINLPTLARVAGCSPRALQLAFTSSLGLTPMQFVLRVRLARARHLIEKSNRDEPIAAIASKTGFSNLGRFSQRYRQSFGESPSETLRRRLDRRRSSKKKADRV